MAWDFETDPAFQAELDWVRDFVRDEVEPLDLVLGDPHNPREAKARALVPPLQQAVKERGLWACHLEPALGGHGYGQLQLALMNEILGRARWAPTVFGNQAPDSGNAEILSRFGTEAQKERFLRPLLDGEITSTYSMTEPHAGADPTLFTTRAVRDGDEWVINGEKWFSSHARHASLIIVMAVTDPDASPYEGMSMFVVPTDTPGLRILRDVATGMTPPEEADHAHLAYEDVRVPADALLGEEGGAFAIAQTRLAGGRVHHAMRTVALVQRAFDAMCERSLSRTVRAGRLADLQMTQEKIADSWIELEQFRLLVLRTAWLIDKHRDYRKVRKDIAAVKVVAPRVLHSVAQRAMHLHGALGVSQDMPFLSMLLASESLAVADGPSEVHQVTIARQVLRDHEPKEGLWPSEHLPTRTEASIERYAAVLEREIGNQ